MGGGHAHVQVLRRWMMQPLPGVRLTLVVDRPEAVYSGMVPGFVAGDYALEELEVDVVPLARRARARVVVDAAVGLDPVGRSVALASRPPLHFDLVSLDVGSTVRGLDLPGARAHALATRPIRDFADRLSARLEASLFRGGGAARLAVVGGGAAGVELSLTLEARLRGLQRRPELRASLVLVTDGEEILPGASRALIRRARAELRRRGIGVHTGARVARVTADALHLVGERDPIPCDLAVWATGAAPPPVLAQVPLAKDERGFLRVDAMLRTPEAPHVFAVGDCAALDAHPWVPKAGVYAVREGPLLDANLRAQLSGGALRPYRPQRDFLALLHLGDGRSLGGKWGLAVSGRPVLRLKDAIDRRFVRRFQVLDPSGADAPGFPTPEAMGMEEMPCGGCAAKVASAGLEAALARLGPPPPDRQVVLGLEARDDVGAWRSPGGDVVLASLDGFRAFTDDPWLVGRVAALNAVSDVHASGGVPRAALAWVHVPEEGARGAETLFQVLAGVRAALDPLGVSLLGGHSTVGEELLVGLAVTGEPWPGGALLAKAGLRPGDRLVLTKALGTGVVLAADMQGRARGAWVGAAWESMLRPNVEAARVTHELGVRACTDVSGFGLAVHLGEMLRAGAVAAELDGASLPALPGALALLERGVRSSFHADNERAARALLEGADAPAVPAFALACDPQTAGGLLLGVPAGRVDEALAALRAAGDVEASAIGRVEEARPGAPRLRFA